MIGMMEIIRQDDYKIIPRSGSVLPSMTPIRKPKYLTLRDVTFINPTFNPTCHKSKSHSDKFQCNIRSVVLSIWAF